MQEQNAPIAMFCILTNIIIINSPHSMDFQCNPSYFWKIRSTRHDGIKCRQVNKDQVFRTQETSGKNLVFFLLVFFNF